ncbi:MAG: cytochrome c biogenesis heme-transporting ATPase CcmA [Gammaproteobacteria bacterium]
MTSQVSSIATVSPRLDVQGLTCRFNHFQLFADLGFNLSAGDILQVRGDNGSGKTTLLRILSGLKPAEAGEIRWNGKPIHAIDNNYFKQLCYLGHRNAIKPGLTVLENLTMQQLLTSGQNDQTQQQILAGVSLTAYADTLAGQLSSGQLRRLAITRLLLSNGKIWLLDEPYTALDKQGKLLINELLLAHSQQGGIAIIATHEAVSMDGTPLKTFTLN